MALLLTLWLGCRLVRAQEAGPEYRVAPRITTVTLDAVPDVVRLDLPGRPRLGGVQAEEIVQLSPHAGRVMIASGGGGRLYHPPSRKPIWSGRVDGAWTLSPDGARLAVESERGVQVWKFAPQGDGLVLRAIRSIRTHGPVRMLFGRDSRRLLTVDGSLALEIHDLEKPTPPSRSMLVKDGGMLDYLYMFPDNHTLLYDVQHESGAGQLYSRDLRDGRTAIIESYNGEDWSSNFRVSWDGRWVWTGNTMRGGGTTIISDVERVGVRGVDEVALKMHALVTAPGATMRPGVVSVGNAVAYALADRVEVLDATTNVVIRIEGWPIKAHEGGPSVVGFLAPQRMLAVQLGASVYLLPVAIAAGQP